MPRPLTNLELSELLPDARRATLACVGDLAGDQWLGPKLDIVNPPLWEIGHLAWFQELWCLRRAGVDAATTKNALLQNADALYDSNAVAHDTRWHLPLPAKQETFLYMEAVLHRVCERLAREPENASLNYFAQLALFHEDMHAEALAYTRQTHGYAAPDFGGRLAATGSTDAYFGAYPGDAAVGGGRFLQGATPAGGFVFDNEKWAHEVVIEPFHISKIAVTNAEFAAFVEAGGYGRQAFWSAGGWAWRTTAQVESPLYWRQKNGAWQQRVFDEWQTLAAHQPVIHVNWFEAEAYCHWAGRRLPSEAEWEFAAATTPAPDASNVQRPYPWGDAPASAQIANLDGRLLHTADVSAYPEGDSAWGCRQMFGNVWEWTADSFMPYPGFVADPYKEYSQPWFGSNKVLRGGCFMTRSRMLRNTLRNFFTPERRDVFAGFRTCALD